MACGFNSGAYLAEIIRSGIQAVDNGQTEAARSLGMTNGQNMRFIVLPQALKIILPAMANEFVTLIKGDIDSLLCRNRRNHPFRRVVGVQRISDFPGIYRRRYHLSLYDDSAFKAGGLS